jgi:hypothetical protein
MSAYARRWEGYLPHGEGVLGPALVEDMEGNNKLKKREAENSASTACGTLLIEEWQIQARAT